MKGGTKGPLHATRWPALNQDQQSVRDLLFVDA